MPSLSEALSPFSTVVISGGSSGIGKSFIELVANLRPEIRFCNLSRTAPAVNISGEKLNHFACDVSRPGDVVRAVAEVRASLAKEQQPGQLLLINNAGFGGYGHFADAKLGEQLEMIDLNVRGLVQLTGLLLPSLQQRGGAVLNVASTAAFQPTAYMATYGATKAFVLHWTLALNEELRGTNVRAAAVCPGPTATQFFRRAGLQQGSVADSLSMSPDKVAELALREFARGRPQIVTGWKNKAIASLSRFVSKPLAARVGAKILARYRLKKAKP